MRAAHRRSFPTCEWAGSWRTFPPQQEFRVWRRSTGAKSHPREAFMQRKSLYASVAAIALAAFLAGTPAPAFAQQAAAQVAIDNDDIGGVVTGPKGPEAGVWVIAETNDLPTRYAKMVVTDDQGRYVIPDLPTANYEVWVRGYGLIDSPKLRAKPGQHLDIAAVPAPNA